MWVLILLITFIVFKLLQEILSHHSTTRKDSSDTPNQYTTEQANHYTPTYYVNKEDEEDEEDEECYEDDEKLANHFSDLDENDNFRRMPIKGISFCKIRPKDVGVFHGKAIAEKDNKYDEYAISLYKDGKRIGYTPAGSIAIHDYILLRGGTVDISGYINGRGSFFWGVVYIEFNETDWAESLPVESLIYANSNLRMHNIEDVDESVGYGVFEGKARIAKGRHFPIEIFNNNGEKIGVVRGNINLYYTMREVEGGEVEVWGSLKKNYSYVYIPVKCGPKKIANAKAKFKDEIKPK